MVSLFRGDGEEWWKRSPLLFPCLMYMILPVLTIDVHLLTHDPGGTIILNTTLDHEGTYAIDGRSSNAFRFLHMREKDGVVLIDTTQACKHMKQNPLRISLNFKSNHNLPKMFSASIPYLIYLDDRVCTDDNKTPQWFTLKNRLEANTNTRNDTHTVQIYLPATHYCFSANEPLLSLKNVIPIPFHQCSIKTTLLSSGLSISGDSLDLSFVQNFCIQNYLKIEAQISLLCPSGSLLHSQLVTYLFSFHPPTTKHAIHDDNNSNVMLRRKRSSGNNHSPLFNPTTYTKHFKEEQATGTTVITVTATDEDTGDNGLLTYSMVADRDVRSQDMFEINPETGTITTTKVLDREEMDHHYFIIYAKDKAIPISDRLTASASLTIVVDDVNDHTPVFQKGTNRIEVYENGGKDVDIFTANAADEDTGKNADILYSIQNPGPPNDVFLIDPPTGVITTQRSLDREEHSSYKLIIQAVDQGILNDRRTATMTLSIRVKDKNDNSPVFTEKNYEVRLMENRPVSRTSEILTVKATDKDITGNGDVTYKLVNDGQENFMIDEISGKLYLIKKLDFEDEQEYTLSVRAEDHGKPIKRTTVTVLVHVLDINDQNPEFLESSYIRNVDEDIDKDTPVIQVQALDRDSDENAALTYSIIQSSDIAQSGSFPFVIDAATGWIRTSERLDRETQDTYKFLVKATDNGSPKRSASVSVSIGLKDINDNPPVFEHKVYNASISENAKKRDPVIRLLAVDKDVGDNARISYRIDRGNDGDAFLIMKEQNKGVIVVNKKLDARNQNKYILTISAADIDGKRDTAQVVIDVQDTNRHAPVFQKNSAGYSFSVKEDVPIGTSVYEVLALDNDRAENARITYSLSPLSVFSIDPDSGVIKTRQKLDREMVADYNLFVKATDNGQPRKSVEAEAWVTVLDVNDNKPEFSEPRYSFSIPENERVKKNVLLKIKAEDKDSGPSGRVKYTFEGGNDGGGTFSIDSQGNILLIKAVDREKIPYYDLIAIAMDSDPVSPQSSSVSIHATITDINDEPPVFESDLFTVLVEENSQIGTTVADITATDADKGENALVEYNFAAGSDTDYFRLSRRKGDPAIITTTKVLDYESGKHEYKLYLTAKSDTFISTATVIVRVQDINDNEPQLNDFSIIFNNFMDNFITGPIGRIPAFDPDVSDRDSLVYKIISGNEANLLHLNESSGQLTLDHRLNSDVPRTGTFLVSVSDGQTEVKATCNLLVRLVTQAMLHNAVTIRLDKMTVEAFLSPLLGYFRDALASILSIDNSDVFVINLEDDTDVPEQILNVSVSCRKDSVLMHGQTRDVFYSPEYLREVVYLHRERLANLSKARVLPFDDNLCLREPCANFESCRSFVEQGIPRPVVASRQMLFRSIHPTQLYKCVCPHGFAGMNVSRMCDTEVDLCYSSPCLNGGTCVRRESGYTCICANGFDGHDCEVNTTQTFTSRTCPSDLCRGKSRCEPQPPDTGGGFFCKECPSGAFYDAYCRLRSRHFRKGSYLTFPSIKGRNRFTIRLRFATLSPDGLLLYNGRFNGEHDFIALEIVGGQVRFSFNLGSNETVSATTSLDGGVNTGDWVSVTVEYVGRVATLTVGEDCDPGIVIAYGHRLGSHACAVRVELELPEKCENPIVFCNRLLDLTGPLIIGSLSESVIDEQFSAPDFEGCISDLEVDNTLVDLVTAVSDNQTIAGCPPKIPKCLAAPCKLGGKCREGWNTYHCDCQEKTGGKDCTQRIEPSRQFGGGGYMSFNNFAAPTIPNTWINGLAFRTRQADGVLMQILLNRGEVVIEIVSGYIQYIAKGVLMIMDMTRVDDGAWHYFEVRWYNKNSLELFLDYEQHVKKVTSPESVSDHRHQMVYIGAYRDGLKPMSRYFVGCIKDVRVGVRGNLNLSSRSMTNVTEGCTSRACQGEDVCGVGQCVDLWNKHTCQCPPGTIGPKCEDICSNYNPCQNWADCKSTSGDLAHHPHGYECQCGSRQSGPYCQYQGPQTCPKQWWGKPLCGPCNCDEEKGFSPHCNETNGTCTCKSYYYLPHGSDRCVPCNCYRLGATSMDCDPHTGQCSCQKNVMGRRCDQCDNPYAGVRLAKKTVKGEEVTLVTCVVSYDNCPSNYAEGIWWEPVAFGLEKSQDCPAGVTGNALRNCTKEDSWLEPDLFNCTSNAFMALDPQLTEFESGSVTPYVADHTIGRLQNLSYYTPRIYGNDILMTYRFTKVILDYELSHSGLEMISQRYRDFVQKLLVALSNVTNTSYTGYWSRINRETGGATHLVNLFDKFVNKTVYQMPLAKSPTFEAVSGDMGTDWINVGNVSSITTIPKYDNNVRKRSIDKEAAILIPSSLFPARDIGPVFKREADKAYVGYVIIRDLAKHMSVRTDSSIRRTGRPMTVNSPVLGIILYHDNDLIQGNIKQPVQVKLRLRLPNNRTNMYCARYVPDKRNDDTGIWTADACRMRNKTCQVSPTSDHCEEYYVTCECRHLSLYAVIIDVADGTSLLPALIDMEVVTYILVCMSLLMLLLSFFILFTFKRLQCKWNSIHINFIFTIIIVQVSYIIGINQTSPELFCRIVAIALHFFYIAAFAWLMVEVYHIHAMLTEKPSINHGSMKFYYLLAYVLPGIVVGLAVGLYTEAYGNASFCWLDTSQSFIWSFIGPIIVVIVLFVLAFIRAAKASCGDKIITNEDISVFKSALLVSILLLLLLVATWVIGLLSVNFDIQALHYLHALCLFVVGLFVFMVYVMFNKKVRWCIKRFYYRCKGKKVEFDDIHGVRKPPQSRSALSYHQDSDAGSGGVRISNMGMSTTLSTLSQRSRGSSKATSVGVKSSVDILHSTSSSTSNGLATTTTIPPYGGGGFMDGHIKEERANKGGNDSDSDSDDGSIDRNSLELASSHSSDDDDDIDIDLGWEDSGKNNKAVELVREQIAKMKKEKEKERIESLNDAIYSMDPQGVEEIPEDPRASPPHYPMPSNPPDVTLHTRHQLPSQRPVIPPIRSDSLRYSPNNNNNNTNSSNSPVPPPLPPPNPQPHHPNSPPTYQSSRPNPFPPPSYPHHYHHHHSQQQQQQQQHPNPNPVQVLTHNGSVSSDSESDETTV